MSQVNWRCSRLTSLALLPSLLSLALLTDHSRVLAAANDRGTLTIQSVQGRAEVQGSDATWRIADDKIQNTTLERALRTGTGRATLTNKVGGRTILGSASRVRLYSDETDLQAGQFLMEGPAAVFARGSHLVMEGTGKARIDISPDGSTQRVAVIQGTVRVSNGAKLIVVPAGQQLTLNTFQRTAFTEDDPWYAAMFTGSGAASIEAMRGTVRWQSTDSSPQPARVGLILTEGNSVLTTTAAWAEIGFTGGGYLRLTEESELKVLAVEKTSRGREVTLQLLRGSAWNVVEKGQGGYKISTPVVSTAVRGTKFRVDASGMVKVMEGDVALPSSPGVNLNAGQQKPANGSVEVLQKDALDLFNEARDAERAAQLKLTLAQFARHQQELTLQLSGSGDVTLQSQARNSAGQWLPLTVTGDPVSGQYEVQGESLPDGRYTVQLSAARFGQHLYWSPVIWVDHTPPTITGLRRTTLGRIVTLSGTVQDQAGGPLTLKILGGEQQITRQVEGSFQLLLPPALARGELQIQVLDAAGNSAHAVIH